MLLLGRILSRRKTRYFERSGNSEVVYCKALKAMLESLIGKFEKKIGICFSFLYFYSIINSKHLM